MDVQEYDYDASEVLGWLCWNWAQTGQRFYPPNEKAKQISCNHPELNLENERIKCGEKFWEAYSKFEDMERWGFESGNPPTNWLFQ